MSTITPKLSRMGYFAILGSATLPALATATISVVLPAISDAFSNGSNGVQVKMVATALGLGMLIGAPLGGGIADRFGRRTPLIAATAIFGIGGCAIFFAHALWQIILARLIIGLATGVLGVTVIAVIGDNFAGAERNRWIGFNAAVGTFFILFANPVVGILTDIGWRYGFIMYALAFPILLTMIYGIPRKPLDTAVPSAPQSGRGIGGVSISSLILAVVVGTLSTGTSLYWPFRFRELGVNSAREIAIYALPNILLLGIAASNYGRFCRSLSIRQIFLIGALASGAGLVAIASATAPWMVVVGLAIEGGAIGLLMPNLTSYALAVSPPDWRARNLGLMKGALYGSPFLTQFFLEPLSSIGGASMPLWAISAMALALALAVISGALARPATPA